MTLGSVVYHSLKRFIQGKPELGMQSMLFFTGTNEVYEADISWMDPVEREIVLAAATAHLRSPTLNCKSFLMVQEAYATKGGEDQKFSSYEESLRWAEAQKERTEVLMLIIKDMEAQSALMATFVKDDGVYKLQHEEEVKGRGLHGMLNLDRRQANIKLDNPNEILPLKRMDHTKLY